MPSPPTINRVSSRVKGKYLSGEFSGNVEAVAVLGSSSYDEADNRDARRMTEGLIRHISSDAAKEIRRTEYGDVLDDRFQQSAKRPYGLRRIFSNPSKKTSICTTSTSATLISSTSSVNSLLADDEHQPTQNEKSKPYGLRRIFSNPHDQNLAKTTVLTKTKSYHHPDQYEDKFHENKLHPSPLSLVRRVSRLRNKEVEVAKPVIEIGDDEDTFAESIDTFSSNGASKSQQARKGRRKCILLFFVSLGMASVGGYMAYTYLFKNNQSTALQSFEEPSSSESPYVQDSPVWAADGYTNPTDDEEDSQLVLESDASSIESEINGPTYSPTALSLTDAPFAEPTHEPTREPTPRPSHPPSHRPSPRPSYPPSPRPTPTPPPVELKQDTTITFYVMADAPYSDEERETVMPDVIDSLPSDAELLFHLGDLEYKKEDQCGEWAYEAASSILKRSRVPVFVVPGDNDINDCEDHEEAEDLWTEYFGYMDRNWSHSIYMQRWGKLDESFSFLRNRILFFGIHIVGGKPYDEDEKVERHMEHLHMLKSIMNDHRWDYDIVVLLGHAEPKDRHADLFEGEDGLAQFVSDMRKPFLHIHGDWHEWYEVQHSFGVENYLRISLDSLIREDGEVAVPIRVEIDSSKRYGAVKVSRGRTGWDVECCSGDGWPKVPSDDDDYTYVDLAEEHYTGDDYYSYTDDGRRKKN